MDKRIIYQNEDGGMAIIIPADCGLTIEEIAAKDVPTGAPYKIVNAAEIPTDRTDRDTWQVDPATLTDGIGAYLPPCSWRCVQARIRSPTINPTQPATAGLTHWRYAMKLIPNAGQTAMRAYSMWSNYMGIACLVAPEVIYAASGVDTNPRFWWVLGLGLILFGIFGRLVDQDAGGPRRKWLGKAVAVALALALIALAGSALAMSKPQPEPPVIAQTSEAATMAVAVPLVGKWEGKRNTAYLDTIASPPVWTVCYGETRGVKRGDTYTDAQCDAMLARGLVTYRNGLHGYLATETKATRLTPQRDAAYVSLAYNVGIAGAGKSTATRRLNDGDIAGGCEAIGWWNRSGGRVVRGLVNRRADEVRLCRIGL